MNAIISLEMRKNLQDKGLVFWTLILPIIFTVLFISIFTSGVEESVKNDVILSIVPGYIVMFTFFIMITMVDTILKDLNKGMTARFASTPLSPMSYLFGKWIPYMYVVFIQIIALFIFGKLVYQIPMEQPILLLILSLLMTITVTGFGLALALLVKTFNMGIAITQVIALGGALLSGLWVPINMMPPFLQTFGKFLPQYWAHQAFQDAMAGNLLYSDFFLTLAILFGFSLLGCIIAVLKYPSFLARARS